MSDYAQQQQSAGKHFNLGNLCHITKRTIPFALVETETVTSPADRVALADTITSSTRRGERDLRPLGMQCCE